MRALLTAILLFFPFCGWSLTEAAERGVSVEKLQEIVENLLAEEALDGAVVSICARTGGGKTLVDIGADNMVMPASNIKLITTGAAMHALGSDYRFSTGIGYSGRIEGCVLRGDLYITGGGDPTIGSRDSIAVPIDEIFSQWGKAVRRTGVRRIEGRVIGDGRYFDGMTEHPTWQWCDVGTYYGSGATGLMFYENMLSFSVTPGQSVGSPINISQTYPETPWMKITYDCATGRKGTGDMLYMYTSELAPVAEVRGTFGIDRGHKRVDFSNKFPEYTAAKMFLEHLESHGFTCSEGPADLRLHRDTEASDAVTNIVTTHSPVLSRIAFEINHSSNNLYAEAVYRNLSCVKTGKACYDSCSVALNQVLEDMAVDPKGLYIVDGSGLSRKNVASADFFCRFLEQMMSSPCFESYIESLPSPGFGGTLSRNMTQYPEQMRERIKAKSGTMEGVRCYSGYIIPTEGCKEDTIIFSILINNSTASSSTLRTLCDKIMALLAATN